MPLNSNVLPNTIPPIVLSGQLTQVVGQDVPADILIEGIPFFVKPSDEFPYVREANEDQKEQFDTSREAGENSFGQWWLRSQGSFHGGQGQKFLDSGDPEIARTRYYTSNYAYPHEAGELTVAGTVTSTASGRNGVEQVTWSGQQKLVTMSTSTFQIHVANLPGLTGASTINLGASGIPTAMTSDGENVYVAIADKIYRVNAAGTATHTHNLTFSGPVVMGFAKQRLIVCVGNKVYELDPNPGAPPVAVGAAHYTNPSTGYVYTSVAEAPTAIYLTGYSGPKSDASSMSVTESAGTIVLGPPIGQLFAPPGELFQEIFFYLGSFFAVATTRGVHVGTFTPYAQPVMGALIDLEGKAAYSVTGSSTLLWIGADDSIWTVDLSSPVDQVGTYAHAKVASGVGTSSADGVNDLTVLPGVNDLMFGTTAAGQLLSQPTFVQSTPATLTTSWARFDTVEPKQLYYVALEGDAVIGELTVEASTGESASFMLDGNTSTYEFATGTLPASQSFRLSFEITSGTLRSYQMKALPTPRRFKNVILPLMLNDSETPVQGQPVGYPGFAHDRMVALETLCETNQRVNVKDNLAGVTYQAVIRRYQYVQDKAPAEQNNLGGIANVVLRLV